MLKISLSIVFYFFISLYGLITRIFGKHYLELEYDDSINSYWIDKKNNPATNIITWSADDATVGKTIVINFTDDVIDEGQETIIITLSGVSGGAQDGSQLQHTITLDDSDSPPVMQFTNSTMSVDESDGSITIPDALVPFMGGKTEIRPVK